MKNSLRNSIFISCLISMTAMADNPIDQVLPDAPALAPYGEYSIGVRTLNLINPNQIDVVTLSTEGPNPKDGSLPIYDRPLTVEIWYPAADKSYRSDYGKYNDRKSAYGKYRNDKKPHHHKDSAYNNVYLFDGTTKVSLSGKAKRNAPPANYSGPYPLIIISHGYPGNRFLLTPIAENLASKGYVVVSIDHTDSTYRDQNAFVSTLVNRPLDQMFVLNAMEQPNHFLSGLIDTQNTGLIGYSMGGYGAVVSAGGAVSQVGVDFTGGLLAMYTADNKAYQAFPDPRLKAIVSIGPWGKELGLWDKEGLSGVSVPMLYMAGSADSTSGYENGVKAIFEESVNTDRYLLTFENAEHSAAAPMPAPKEAWNLTSEGFQHYNDVVWDNVRMNNISQHFITAFMGLHTKGDLGMSSYFDLIENANNGVYALDSEGNPTAEHTYWNGFKKETALGLKMEFKEKYQ
ncbi:alpha/beta hydrolase family protein [Marinomonas transparens]|uniref:Dienelactone hydrolase n=1 Tax=Marinomonas transparens TaxID=2795388 RepID=A0A934MV78_9GAMM|nr:dienelactone hydrolase [Marinomonas transparens]MBJ7536724.1 dienelactone hydrolase [Marinomonas transparens]